MMYSKRKTLHYITKEMFFLSYPFVTDRPSSLILKRNKVMYRIVQKKSGKE